MVIHFANFFWQPLYSGAQHVLRLCARVRGRKRVKDRKNIIEKERERERERDSDDRGMRD